MNNTKIFFILHRPSYLGNIGSTARVLKNFGFENMRLVGPPKNYKDAESRKMSVGAFDVLKKAVVYQDFAGAISDIDIVIGTTCATQRNRQTVQLNEIGTHVPFNRDLRIAFVFGGEQDGLSNEELDLCHFTLRIPTVADFGSLNLAQSVGIIAYELIRDGGVAADSSESLELKEVNEFFEGVERLLALTKFTREYNKNNIMRELKNLFERAKPSTREFQVLHAALRKVSRKVQATNDEEQS